VVTGLRKSGASTGAAAAFFLGNPALNPAVLVFLALSVGFGWAALRLVLAVVLVFGTALLLTRLTPGTLIDPEKVHTEYQAPEAHGTWIVRWFKSLGRLVVALIPEYIIMILALGAVRAFLFPKAGPELGNNIVWIVLLAIAGMLMAIPTAGEIPIISTMRGFGMGSGPAGALLLTLAPISLPSLVMVSKVFPRKALVVMGVAVIVVGIVAGVIAATLGL
jgi:uncharacterized membrane protein YraQ (UPF0718 family)